MKRVGIITALSMLLVAVLAAVALATVSPGAYSPTYNSAAAPSGTHYKSGSPTATCTVASDGSVTCGAGVGSLSSYTLGGVGNTNATETLTATYTATVVCINGGSNPSDSQHQGSFPKQTGPIPLHSTKNGFLEVTSTSVTAPTKDQFLAQQTCPNTNWTPTVPGGITLHDFTYTLSFAGFTGAYITISATDP